jgi:hypothetical protein
LAGLLVADRPLIYHCATGYAVAFTISRCFSNWRRRFIFDRSVRKLTDKFRRRKAAAHNPIAQEMSRTIRDNGNRQV